MRPTTHQSKVILTAPEFEPPEDTSIYRQHLHDQHGSLLGVVEMYEQDLRKLREQGLTGKLSTKTGQSGRYVVIKNRSVIGTTSVVARLILNTRKGLTVRYRDGNRFNLKRDNLYYQTGKAKGETLVDSRQQGDLPENENGVKI